MTKYLLKNVVYLKKVHERYLLLGSVGIMTPQGELIQILEAFQWSFFMKTINSNI